MNLVAKLLGRKKIGLAAVCALVSIESLTQDRMKSAVQFALAKEDATSITQIIGLCDGTPMEARFNCSTVRINLVKGDAISRKILGGGPDQCYLQAASDGKALKFSRTKENTWVASSEPSVLCGRVDTYTLENVSPNVFWKMTIASRYTDLAMPFCQLEPARGKAEYSSSPLSIACDGVKVGPNPAF